MITKFKIFEALETDEIYTIIREMMRDYNNSPADIHNKYGVLSTKLAGNYQFVKCAIQENRADIVQYIFDSELDNFTISSNYYELFFLAGDYQKFEILEILSDEVLAWNTVLRIACSADYHLGTLQWIQKKYNLDLFPMLYSNATGTDEDTVKISKNIIKQLIDWNCPFNSEVIEDMFNDTANYNRVFDVVSKLLDDAAEKDITKINLLKDVEINLIKEYFPKWFFEKYQVYFEMNQYSK